MRENVSYQEGEPVLPYEITPEGEWRRAVRIEIPVVPTSGHIGDLDEYRSNYDGRNLEIKV